ncbi:MAG TPA: NAD-dependent epimerase/dehydratase family protein [Gemmatimonadales bacterium]|jgi:nucleoside-diphosphate-sugar epimerase
MRCVAVTGAAGRIGAPLVRQLVAAGVQVRALSRRRRESPPGVEWITGDLLEPRTLAALVDGADVVVHAGGQLDGAPEEVERSLVEGTRAVLDAARAIRMVHVSSLVVLQTARRAENIDEESALEPMPERRGIYTRAKSAAEALVRSRGATQDVVVVRPGIVVDDTVTVPTSVALAVGPIDLFVGPRNGTMPLVHSEDVASGLIVVAGRSPRGDVVHLVDPLPVTRDALHARLKARSRRGTPVPVGGMIVGLARMMSAMPFPTVGNAAYRLASAGSDHRWPVRRADDLGWRPSHLANWLGTSR